jgi:post-segregation antitoxin (ccd killing protein)
MSKTILGKGTKQKITVTVDSNLIADIDNLTNNRSAAVEEALFLWRKQQFESSLAYS